PSVARPRSTDPYAPPDPDVQASIYAPRVLAAPAARPLAPGALTTSDIESPPLAGLAASAAIDLQINHANPTDLSVALTFSGATSPRTLVLLDSWLNVRSAMSLVPTSGT